jgi:Flp pilus assembly protein TadG
VIDGELVASDHEGRHDFRALHFRKVPDDQLSVWAFDLLFFVRDPIVIAAYVYALLRFGVVINSGTQMLGLLLAVAGVVAGAVNLADGRIDVRIFGYGIRNYFFYLPMVYVMGQRFTYAGWRRLVTVNVWLQVPLGALSIVQFWLPGSHWINAGLIEGGLMQPGVYGDVIRAYGTFSSSSGQTTFIAFSMAILLWCLTLPKNRRPVSAPALVLGTAGTVSMLAVSGSRGAFVSTAFLAFVIMGSKALSNRNGWRSVRAVATVTILILLSLFTVFSGAYEALYDSPESSIALARDSAYVFDHPRGRHAGHGIVMAHHRPHPRDRQRGETLIEFALSLTIFLMTLLGIMQFGVAVFRYNMLSNLAQEGARWASVRGQNSGGMAATEAQVQSFVSGRSLGISVTTHVYTVDLDHDCTTTTTNPSALKGGEGVCVKVTHTTNPFTRIVRIGALNLSSTAQMIMTR